MTGTGGQRRRQRPGGKEDALTAYIIRRINTRLFVAGQPFTAEGRESMLCTWYRLNAVRVALSAGAWFSASMAQRHGEQ